MSLAAPQCQVCYSMLTLAHWRPLSRYLLVSESTVRSARVSCLLWRRIMALLMWKCWSTIQPDGCPCTSASVASWSSGTFFVSTMNQSVLARRKFQTFQSAMIDARSSCNQQVPGLIAISWFMYFRCSLHPTKLSSMTNHWFTSPGAFSLTCTGPCYWNSWSHQPSAQVISWRLISGPLNTRRAMTRLSWVISAVPSWRKRNLVTPRHPKLWTVLANCCRLHEEEPATFRSTTATCAIATTEGIFISAVLIGQVQVPQWQCVSGRHLGGVPAASSGAAARSSTELRQCQQAVDTDWDSQGPHRPSQIPSDGNTGQNSAADSSQQCLLREIIFPCA